MKKRILVAPLNWGLGHITRCMPIIDALILNDFVPVIASDGSALELSKKEYKTLEHLELPAYNITYAKKGSYFKWKLLMETPRLIKTITAEKKAIEKIIETHKIDGIISDNRLGVYSHKVPSVFITHQLNVLSGNTTWITTKIHQKIIKKFNACWVPDLAGDVNLSGKLGHIEALESNIKYIGPLSRFEKGDRKIVNDILVLLSGPEPQRSMLEVKLLNIFKDYNGTIVFIKGVLEKEQTITKVGNMTIYNFMTSKLLEKTLNESKLVISRSGYTTLMDLVKLNKKAFFIPTPGQFEQEYLAKRLTTLSVAPSCSQDNFRIEMLDAIDGFKGFESLNYDANFKALFSLF